MLQSTDLNKFPEKYQFFSMDTALRAEKVTMQLRKLVYGNSLKQKTDYLKEAIKEHNINIQYENDILAIHLPSVLHKRKLHVNTAFLNESIIYALQDYVSKNNIPIFKHCVVCFCQMLDPDFSEKHISDFDNLEYKQILDTIGTFVLYDDSSLYCDIYHTTMVKKDEETIVYIMDKKAFLVWYENVKKFMFTIAEICQ